MGKSKQKQLKKVNDSENLLEMLFKDSFFDLMIPHLLFSHPLPHIAQILNIYLQEKLSRLSKALILVANQQFQSKREFMSIEGRE